MNGAGMGRNMGFHLHQRDFRLNREVGKHPK